MRNEVSAEGVRKSSKEWADWLGQAIHPIMAVAESRDEHGMGAAVAPVATSAPMQARRPPPSDEIVAMAGRIAAQRGMNAEQQEMVRSMLHGLSDTVFAGGAVMLPTGPRPPPEYLEQMTQGISHSGGDPKQIKAMLTLITDVLFGATDSRQLASSTSSAPLVRPSPRKLSAIAKRVALRSGGPDREEAVTQMLETVMRAMFDGPGGVQESVQSSTQVEAQRRVRSASRSQGQDADVAAIVAEQVASQLVTARSSVRSQSTTSEQVREEVNLEVRNLLAELCTVLYAEKSPR